MLQTLTPSINTVLNVIDKASAERDSNIRKFCQSLDKDIAELGRELKEIKSQANVRFNACWFWYFCRIFIHWLSILFELITILLCDMKWITLWQWCHQMWGTGAHAPWFFAKSSICLSSLVITKLCTKLTIDPMISSTKILVTDEQQIIYRYWCWWCFLCQHPMILDAKADPEKVGVLLSRLQTRMDALHERATTFKNYQKTFKVSGRSTTFRAVCTDLVLNEVIGLILLKKI